MPDSSFSSLSARPNVTRLSMMDLPEAPQISRPFLTRTEPRIPGTTTTRSRIVCGCAIGLAFRDFSATLEFEEEEPRRHTDGDFTVRLAGYGQYGRSQIHHGLEIGR